MIAKKTSGALRKARQAARLIDRVAGLLAIRANGGVVLLAFHLAIVTVRRLSTS